MTVTKPQLHLAMDFNHSSSNSEKTKSANKAKRIVDWAFGFVYGSAFLASMWFVLIRPATKTVDDTSAIDSVLLESLEPEEDYLWETLGSSEFVTWHERYQIERRAALLKEAQADRETARDYKVLASQSIASSFLPHSPGEEIVSTTAVSVDCFDEGDFGWVAVLTQLEANSPYEKQGKVANLAECYSGRREANSAIGRAGKYQPTMRD